MNVYSWPRVLSALVRSAFFDEPIVWSVFVGSSLSVAMEFVMALSRSCWCSVGLALSLVACVSAEGGGSADAVHAHTLSCTELRIGDESGTGAFVVTAFPDAVPGSQRLRIASSTGRGAVDIVFSDFGAFLEIAGDSQLVSARLGSDPGGEGILELFLEGNPVVTASSNDLGAGQGGLIRVLNEAGESVVLIYCAIGGVGSVDVWDYRVGRRRSLSARE